MSEWNFDIEQAPKGHWSERKVAGRGGSERTIKTFHATRLIVASKCGVVTSTRWIPGEERWEMFMKDSPPIAWQFWPDHPHPGSTDAVS